MNASGYKKMIGQAAVAALCVALLMYIALIPSTAHAGTSGVLTVSVLYGVIAALSLLMLLGYFVLIKQRERSFVLLFSAILITNFGYFLLSVSGSLPIALLANRLSYFGSAFLPTIMLVIVFDVCNLKYSKGVIYGLFALSFAMFLLAASGGILDVYYKEVSIEIIDGVTHLVKIYGPLHSVYSVYLFGSFGVMLGVITYSFAYRKISTYKQAAVISALVFGNIAVWFVEQLIDTDFEFLSVSYLAAELFLLLFYMMLQDYEQTLVDTSFEKEEGAVLPPDMEELFHAFAGRWSQLTATERRIVQHYADGLDVNEVAELCFISIHTVRKHNANIYHKLGVGSRDELILYLDLFRRCGRLDELVIN